MRPSHAIKAIGISINIKPHSVITRKKMPISQEVSISLISGTIEVFFLLPEMDANHSHLISPKGVSAL
jgi:hypothetical protein